MSIFCQHEKASLFLNKVLSNITLARSVYLKYQMVTSGRDSVENVPVKDLSLPVSTPESDYKILYPVPNFIFDNFFSNVL
jgi:hypothetical protein